MKLSTLIETVNKSNINESYIDIQELLNEFNITDYDVNYDLDSDCLALKSYWLYKIYDTDTYVGIKALFLHDKFVCLRRQNARKDNHFYEFKDKESISDLKEYVKSITIKEDTNHDFIKDMNEELGVGGEVYYSSQLLTKDLIKKETLEKVKVINSYPRDSDYKKWSIVEVEKENGEVETLNLKELIVPFETCLDFTKDMIRIELDFCFEEDSLTKEEIKKLFITHGGFMTKHDEVGVAGGNDCFHGYIERKNELQFYRDAYQNDTYELIED